jgi:hypothetical protein
MLILFGAGEVNAACHVVTPTGSGTKSGADWSNAMADLPSTLIRGDSYYLGPGVYSEFNHNEATNNSMVITIKRATASDHCSDTGYVDASFGRPAGQAVFQHYLALQSGYWVIDGNYPNAKPASIADTGIYIDGTTCTTSNCWPLNLSQSGNTSNIVVKNLSIQGGGDAKQSSNIDENIRIIGGSNFTLQYIEVLNSSNSPIVLRGVNGFQLDHSYLNHNAINSVYHGEGISDSGSSNVSITNNTFKDIEGTGIIVELNAGTVSTAANWNISGNLFFYPPGNPEGRTGTDDGLIACINLQTAKNWTIINNTISGITGLSTRLNFATSSGYCTNPTGIVAYNNLWYNSARADVFGPVTLDYNTYIKMTNVNDTGANSISVPTGADPFVSAATDNYHLNVLTNITPWKPTGTIVPGSNVDMDGVTRTTSRGGYQYVLGSSSSLAPPLLFQPVVQ